ncbi:hypothetical protein HN873_027889 [Arachis hypogaea]
MRFVDVDKEMWRIMGQKINPLGFRLGTTQSHDSLWFAQPINYSENLQEDKKYEIISRII